MPRTNTTEQLRAALTAARDIAAKADNAGRGLTPVERQTVNASLAEAERLKKSLAAGRGTDQLAELAAAEGVRSSNLMGRTFTAGSRPRTASMGGSWNEAVTAELARYGRKALVGSGSTVAPTAWDPEVHDYGAPMRFIQQVIPPGPELEGDTFTYWRQTTRTNNAAPVDKGEKKPTSVFATTKVDDQVRTIAHLSEPVPRQDLDDAQALRDFLESELRLGVLMETDAQILYGDPDATPAGFTGLAEVGGTQVQAFDTDLLTTIRKAITKVEGVGLGSATAVLLHPNDWETAELSRTSGSGEFHLQSAPVDRANARIWGVPVVSSVNVAPGAGWVGDFAGQARFYERDTVRIDWSENVYDPTYNSNEGATDFERNLIRFRAEARGNVAWLRPLAFVEFATTEAASS